MSAVAAAGPQVSVQVADRLGQPGVMGGQHRPSGGRVAQPVEDRHALGRPQDHVERRHAVPTVETAQQLPRRRVAALEHGLEPARRCFALQPEGGGTGAVPAARGLTVAGQVLLVVGGQLAGVVRLPPTDSLAMSATTPPLPPALAGASNAPMVHCSPAEKSAVLSVAGWENSGEELARLALS
jgi:hypothetical protein